MEVFEKNEDQSGEDINFREEIYSKAVRAGKRTYFFDVKSTRREEFYLTITESKKRFEQDGSFHFEKHKIFLYKEDFEKFFEGLQEVVSFIDQNQQDDFDIKSIYEEPVLAEEEEAVLEDVGVGGGKDFTNLDFENL